MILPRNHSGIYSTSIQSGPSSQLRLIGIQLALVGKWIYKRLILVQNRKKWINFYKFFEVFSKTLWTLSSPSPKKYWHFVIYHKHYVLWKWIKCYEFSKKVYFYAIKKLHHHDKKFFNHEHMEGQTGSIKNHRKWILLTTIFKNKHDDFLKISFTYDVNHWPKKYRDVKNVCAAFS